MMLLSRYGLREWMTITVFAALAAGGAIVLLRWYWLALVVGIVWLGLVAFFRHPLRRVLRNLPQGTMLSPADGVISAIERVPSHKATNGHPAIIIRIFLSVLNVHINRWPYDGEVIDITYKPGRFLNAQTSESARVNESNLVSAKLSIDGTLREHFGVRQVSGMIARRIVCDAEVGDTFTRGDVFGMIKFGSTTELILPRPDDVEVCVQPEQKVRAGLTVLAVLKPPTSSDQ
ncbi:MAG: phosphatidylserine decarboxylase [Phycisphaerales bacterium]